MRSHHGHHHHPLGPEGARRFERAFKIGIALNVAFVVFELGWGVAVDSIALISDAGHNLGDVLALALAWGASVLSTQRPTARRTYGMKRATILASMASAVLLCAAVGAVTWEAIARLRTPAPTDPVAIMAVAGLGVLVNGVTAAMFMSGRHRDLNVRGAYLHMAADAVVSLGVVVAGGAIYLTGWLWLDPAIGLLVGVTILVSGFELLRESVDLAMDAVPRHVDPAAVRRYLAGLPRVTGVHDLHIWGMSTTETALTVHLVAEGMEAPAAQDALLRSVADTLRERFGIHHPTIQVEHSLPETGCVYPDRV